MGIYDFTVKDSDGQEVSLARYKGLVVLIVNTATHCGFTPQYTVLQKLYGKYHDQGFEILDFPCNQFGKQAPGTDAEINSFCTLKYNTAFPRFSKIDVNGKNESPLYTFLKSERKGVLGSSIKWNFTKFLIDRQGNVALRYGPTHDLSLMEKDITQKLEEFPREV
jgi:glutathione peroxidase